MFYSREHSIISIERNNSSLHKSLAVNTLSKIAAIGRVGLVSVLAFIIIVAALGVYAYTDFSPMTSAKTTTRSTVTTTSYYATTYSTPFVITNTSTSNNTKAETVINNYTMTTTVPSEINSTTISSVESSETACTPSRYYESTTTLSDQSTTTTEQVYYDGTTCDFGNSLFEPPSTILISAGTLVWTNFQLQENGSYSVSGSISFLSFSESLGANVTVALYLNGILNASSITPVTQMPNEVTNSSLIPSSNSSNSIFALRGVTPTGGVGTQTGSAVNLNGTTITIAVVSDKPLWLTGWTQTDMSKGGGAQFGQSMGQLNGTYEWPDSKLSLPNTLPQATTTLSFELQISGNYGT
jgi:hypothetical protein